MIDGNEMRRRLQDALDRAGNTHTIEDVVAGIREGQMQVFFSEQAFVVTEIACGPRKKWLNVFLAAGELHDVMALQPQLDAFGKEHGCAFMAMTGRRGWAKVLPKHGWFETGVSYARPLQEFH